MTDISKNAARYEWLRQRLVRGIFVQDDGTLGRALTDILDAESCEQFDDAVDRAMRHSSADTSM